MTVQPVTVQPVTVQPVTIVSGATSGIGRSIALMLGARGHRVVAFGLDTAQVRSLDAAVAALGIEVTVLEADVSVQADVDRVVDTALERHGRIDSLVNNAAIGPLGTVLDTSAEDFDRIVAVNLRGPFLASRAVLPHLISQGGGSIVNIGSGAGWGKPNMAAYAASKAGLYGLTMAMAYDHFHAGVRVNMVVPGGGGIVTGMSLARRGGDVGAVLAGAVGTAAGRPATGDDVAETVAFLLADAAAALSGTVIDVGCFSHQGGPIQPLQTSPEPTPNPAGAT